MQSSKNLLFSEGFKRWAYKMSRYNQLGLMHDDILIESPPVAEALRRLPQDIRDERNFRIIRAMQINMEKKILPEEQWTKYEEDKRYLQPYLAEVMAEIKEKEEWNKD